MSIEKASDRSWRRAQTIGRQSDRAILRRLSVKRRLIWYCALCLRQTFVDVFRTVWKPCATCASAALPRLRLVGEVHSRPIRRQIREHGRQLVEVADVLLRTVHPEASSVDLRRKFRRRVLHAESTSDTIRFDGWYTLVVYKQNVYVGWHGTSPRFTRPTDKELSKMSRKVMMQTRVPEDLRNWFKSHCAKNGTTMSAVVVAYMRMLQNHDSGRLPDARQVGR